MKCEKWRYKAENAAQCPFCGGKSVSVVHSEKRYIGRNRLDGKVISMAVYCKCNTCHARSKPIRYIGHTIRSIELTPIYAYGDKAIEEWNKRK